MSQNLIIKNRDEYTIASVESQSSKLENGVYHVKFDTNKGFYLLRVADNFDLPSKMYGNDKELCKRYLEHHENKTKNTGVLLIGIKGTGKTITAKTLCNMSNKPVIMITSAYTSDGFISFMQNEVFHNCVIYIDEFEKIYSKQEDQHVFLNMMDGSMSNSNHNLYVFTCNESKLSTYFENRPGRVMYKKTYGTLSDDEIREVANDMLDANQVEDFVATMDLLNFVTYDILISIIKDIKLFNEDARTVISYMALDNDEEASYEVTEVYKGERYLCRDITTSSLRDTISDGFRLTRAELYDDKKKKLYILDSEQDVKKYNTLYNEYYNDNKTTEDRRKQMHEEEGCPINKDFESFISNKYWQPWNMFTNNAWHFSIPQVDEQLSKVGKVFILKIKPDYHIEFRRRRAYKSSGFTF